MKPLFRRREAQIQLAMVGQGNADMAMVGEDLHPLNTSGAGIADGEEAPEAGGMESPVQFIAVTDIAAIDFEDDVVSFEAGPGSGGAVGDGGNADTFGMEPLGLNPVSAVRWIDGLGAGWEG